MTDDNVVREPVKAGKTWKYYAEALPNIGELGGRLSLIRGRTIHPHPSLMCKTTSRAAIIVPFSEFASELANGSLPQYSFIIPDVLNPAHTDSLAQAGAWLQRNIPL